MARGDQSNILYNQPKIRKEGRTRRDFEILSLQDVQATALPLKSATLKNSEMVSLQMRDDGRLSLLKPLKPSSGTNNKVLRQQLIEPLGDRPWFLSGDGLLWKDEEDFLYLQGTHGSRERYGWDLPGEPLQFYLAQDEIYVLWRDDAGGGSRCLSLLERVPTAPGDFADWQDIYRYPEIANALRLESRDDKSILLYDENDQEGDAISLVTLREKEGLGITYPLDQEMAASVRRDIYQGGEALVTPGVEDGQYYYLDLGADLAELRFADLARGVNKRVSFIAEGDQLDNLHSNRSSLRLRSQGEEVVLLSPGKVVYLDQTRLMVSARFSDDYSEIAFSGDRITLWSPMKDFYQDIKIK